MKHSGKMKKICCSAFAIALTVLMGFNTLGGFKVEAAQTARKENYFVSEYESKEAVQKVESRIGKQIANEGMVLLKNEDNCLPIPEGSKISLFGKNSDPNHIYTFHKPMYNYITLQDSLTSAGFKLNPELIKFYKDDSISGTGREIMSHGQFEYPGLRIGEAHPDTFTEEVKNSINTYNDVALILMTRESGEGRDLPRTMWKDWNQTEKKEGARDGNDHVLQPDENETALIKYCGDHFKKVIILFNVPAQLEAGFLDDPGHYAYHPNIKGALWVGVPANEGFDAVGKILKGEVNPSGKMASSWARDYTKDPTWMNHSINRSSGTGDKKGNQYINRKHEINNHGFYPGTGYLHNYVDYKEGIYLGYRYWETRGFEEGNAQYDSSKETNGDPRDARQGTGILGTKTQSWPNWYDAHVIFPFGYGLSYTRFTQEIIETVPSADAVLNNDTEVTIKVKVTNTGDVAGKDVVQVYYTAPYTKGEIEKAHVNLVGFGKTKILKPNESQEITVTFPVRDMASFDYNDANKNGKKTFELDAGKYEIKLMKNSHELIDSVVYNIAEPGIFYDKDAKTGTEIKPLFEEISNEIPIAGAENKYGYKGYLSRANFEETFPACDFKITARDWIIKEAEKWGHRALPDPNDDVGKPYYNTNEPTFGVKKGIILKDLFGLDYNDPLWDEFLNQFSFEELEYLICNAGYRSGANWPEYGLKEVSNCDDSAGIGNGAPWSSYYGFPRDFITACTWNRELVYEKGVAMGEEALWGNGQAFSRHVGAMYAPSVNMHRSPFSGRNNEYWGEDSLFTGKMAAQYVKGCVKKGLPCFLKHYAINDQETDRFGVMSWLNEQSLREVYARQFEIVVKESNPMGVMTALNRVGPTWCGGHYALNQQLLRDEWGFVGALATDSWAGDNNGLSDPDQMIRAGGNIVLGSTKIEYNRNTPTTRNLVREAAKGLLYMHANSNVINDGAFPVGPKPLTKFDSKTLKVAILNMNYNENIANATISDELYPDSDESEIKYTLAEGSTLPEGLILAEDGTITGKPTTEVNGFKFTVNATFMDFTRTCDFVINIISPNGSIVYSGENTAFNVLVNNDCNLGVNLAKIVKPDATEEELAKLPKVTYSLANGSLLPNGLTLTDDGHITGKTTSVLSNYKFTIVAKALGYKAVAKEFTLSVNNDITFEAGELAVGKVNQSYCQRINLATSDDKITYSLKNESTNRLPQGLTLTEEGYIVGIPEVACTELPIKIIAKGDNTKEVEAEFKLTIGLSFDNVSLMNGNVNEEYFGIISAQGADGIKFSVKEGATLPEGLTLSEDGNIEGTPVKGGNYEITVVASAEGMVSDEKVLRIFIAGNEEGGGCNSSLGISGVITIPALLGAGFVILRKKRK